MRHVLRLVFFAILLTLATSAPATAQECSTADQPTKTWNQQPPDPLCSGSSEDISFTVYSTTVDTCTNNNNGTVYAQSVRQVTGIGYWVCGSFHIYDTKCNPTITQQVTHATSPTDYNRFYLQAWDAILTTSGSMLCAVSASMSRQDFWQCQGVACQSSGGGG